VVIESLFTNGLYPYDLIKIRSWWRILKRPPTSAEDVANLMEGIILRNA